jgi:HrpA-like RNA helicase
MATDILMCLLKLAVQKRDDLKVVIMSATMDADKFVQYFGLDKPFNVPGKTYPVKMYYLEEPNPNWPSAALHTVKHISDNMPPGDILLFVPTVRDVEQLCVLLNEELSDKLEALPLYAGLARAQQQKAMSTNTGPLRKCVVATNVAETSLAIDGLVYVIGK